MATLVPDQDDSGAYVVAGQFEALSHRTGQAAVRQSAHSHGVHNLI